MGRGVGAGRDHVDQQAMVGQRLGLARFVGTFVDRVAQGQQSGMAVWPGLFAQVLEDGGRGGVAHRPGVVGGEQGLDRDACHGPGGKDDQPAGRRLAGGRGAQAPCPAARGAGCVIFSIRGRSSAELAAGRRRRLRPDPAVRARRRPAVHSPPGPLPAIAIQAGMPRERTTTPQCSPSGSAAFGPAGTISTQATRAASAGSAAWISFRAGDLARQRAVVIDELGLELTQGDAGQLALVL